MARAGSANASGMLEMSRQKHGNPTFKRETSRSSKRHYLLEMKIFSLRRSALQFRHVEVKEQPPCLALVLCIPLRPFPYAQGLR